MARVSGLSKFLVLPLLLAQLHVGNSAEAQGLSTQDGMLGLTGAIMGGIVGNGVSSSGNRTAGTAFGALVGAIFGIGVSKLVTPRDEYAYAEALPEEMIVGREYSWRGERFYGSNRLMRSGYSRRYRSTRCRTYRSIIYDTYTGASKESVVSRCRDRGTWIPMQEPILVTEFIEEGIAMQPPEVLIDAGLPTPLYLPQLVVNDYVGAMARASNDGHRMGNIEKLADYLLQTNVALTPHQFQMLVSQFRSRFMREEASLKLQMYVRG